MPRSCEPRIQLGILVILLSTGIAAGAMAADPTPDTSGGVPSEGTKNLFSDTPCASDYEQLCSHTKGRRLGFECLRLRYKTGNLSQECADHTVEVRKAQFDQAQAFKRAWQEACADDIAEHCSEYTKYTAISGCLNRIRDQVAAECDAKLPRRSRHQGPGYIGWRDGSEPENFAEERRKLLRPREAQRIEAEKKAEEQRQRVRDEVRARMEEVQQGADPANADEPTDATDAP